MPVPAEYQRATDKFYEFLEAAKEESGLHHVAVALKKHVDLATFRKVLATLPPDAERFRRT